MRAPYVIGSTEVRAGERRIVDIPLSMMSDHSRATLSVLVIHGKREGPVVFISAAIHGDEIIGTEIVRRLARDKKLQRLAGTLLLVPIVNTFGFISRDRYLPDRRDLNRSFPGSQKGSLASRLAWLFFNEVVSHCSVGIDIHSAAQHRVNLPQIRIDLDNPRARELAEVFNAPVTLGATLRPGSLRQAASDIGVPVMVFEAGEALRFDDASIRIGLRGIFRVLRHLGMLKKPSVRESGLTSALVSHASSWLRAPEGGTLRSDCRIGFIVKEGDELGRISDPFGEQECPVKAVGPGLVIGRSNLPVVNQGDAIFHIATLSRADMNELVQENGNHSGNSIVFDEDEIL